MDIDDDRPRTAAGGGAQQPAMDLPAVLGLPAIGLGATQDSKIGCGSFGAHTSDGRHLSAPEHGQALGGEEALQGDGAIAGRRPRTHEGKIAFAPQRGLGARP